MTAVPEPKDTAPLPRLAWSPREVAAQLGLGYETVLDLIHDGTIRATQLGRHYRISAAELARLLHTTETDR